MRHDNEMRETLESGGTVFGARTNWFTPGAVEVFGELDLDFAWLDVEHGGASAADADALEELERAAAAAGVDLLVRLTDGSPERVRKVLDTGIRNVLIPRVDTAADVRRAVEAAHFEYEGAPGARGVAHSRTAAWGLDVDTDREDETVLVGAMIESQAAVENVEDILSVPRLGFAYVGPGDLAVSMDHAGEVDHPDVQDAIRRAREACADAGVPIGYSVTSMEGAERALDDGYRLVRLGDEVSALDQTVGERRRALDDR